MMSNLLCSTAVLMIPFFQSEWTCKSLTFQASSAQVDNTKIAVLFLGHGGMQNFKRHARQPFSINFVRVFTPPLTQHKFFLLPMRQSDHVRLSHSFENVRHSTLSLKTTQVNKKQPAMKFILSRIRRDERWSLSESFLKRKSVTSRMNST